MENKRHWINYDWFKLFVALVLLVLFLVLLVTMRSASTGAVPGLPAYPTAGFAWNYDAGRKTLNNPEGQAVYQLDADGKTWQPIIPEDVQARLPQIFQLEWKEPGGWALRAPDGGLFYTWDASAMLWVDARTAQETGLTPTHAAGPGLPDFPTASFNWNFSTVSKELLNVEGAPVYKLSEDGKEWVPVIPEEIGEDLPTNQQPQQDTVKGWVLKDLQGKLLYIWDAVTFKWKMAQAAASSTLPAASSTPPPTAVPAVAATTAPTAAPATAVPSEAPAPVTTAAPTEILTSTPAATPSVAAAATAAEVVTLTSVPGCQAPSPSRLVIGRNAKVLSNLNQRNDPRIGGVILTVNPFGAVLKVLDGPVCIPHQESAYLWWRVENKDGLTGWSAENYLSGYGYFLEPMP